MSHHDDNTFDGGIIDGADLGVLAALREVLAAIDPVPSGLAARLKFDVSVHAMHAELASLIDAEPVSVRGADEQADPTTSVTFQSASVSLMVSAEPADDRTVRIDGWVTCGGAVVEAISGDSSESATADAHGRFVLVVPRALMHFVIHVSPGDPSSRVVVTPQVEF